MITNDLPEKVEIETEDWEGYTHQRREIDILYELVNGFNQLIDYLEAAKSPTTNQGRKEE